MPDNLHFFDTHAHIQFPDYGLDPDETWASAVSEGVDRMLAVGCRLDDSILAVKLAQGHESIWASVGIHPHEADEFIAQSDGTREFEALLKDARSKKIVAIGECGLDFYYNNSSKENQIAVLEFQLSMAEQYNLPMIFHVRNAFDEFWPIFERFVIKKGVIHSFTGNTSELEEVLKHDLYIGLNGIMTFTKQTEQLDAAKAAPLDRIVLETDAPYLTPKPFRGNICKPEHVKITAEFIAQLRDEPLEQVANQTTENARGLFNVS